MAEGIYAAIAESSDDAMIAQTLQGVITHWNPAAERIFGFMATEAIGQSIDIIVPANLLAEDQSIRVSVSHGDPAVSRETTRLCKDGSTVLLSVTIAPILSEGIPVGAVDIGRLLTERRRFALVAAQLEAQFGAIVQSSNDAIISTTPEGTISTWNPAAERLFGYAAHEAIGQTLNSFLPLDSVQPRELFSTIRQGETVPPYEVGLKRRDGVEIELSVMIFPVVTPRGELLGVSGILREIGERKRLERKVRESMAESARLKTALDEHAIVVRADLHGNILDVNDKFCKVSGYSRQEAKGKNLRSLASGNYSKTFWDHIAAEGGAGRIWFGEILNYAKDGSKFWVNATIVPSLDENRKPIEHLAIFTDITAAKRSEELERSNAALEAFAYVASHDLQEPLRGVNGCVQLLAERYQGRLGADADEFIQHAVSNVERMQRLVLDLLEYSRAGRTFAPHSPIDCNLVLEAACRNLRAAIVNTGARIEHSNLPVITGDFTQLTQLFQNLLGNAMKFHGSEPPVVTVSATARESADWEFCVADNGIGFPQAQAEKIFGVFQRLHARNRYPGTGIGLAIVKRIIESYGGRIWVQSKPGQGSKFYFTLAESTAQTPSVLKASIGKA